MLAVYFPDILGRFPFAGGVGPVYDSVFGQNLGHAVSRDSGFEYVEPGSHVLAGSHIGHDHGAGFLSVDHHGEAADDGVAKVLPVGDAGWSLYGFVQVLAFLVH